MTISLSDTVENTVRKGENAGYQHFLLFPQGFPKTSSSVLLKKSGLCDNGLRNSADKNVRDVRTNTRTPLYPSPS